MAKTKPPEEPAKSRPTARRVAPSRARVTKSVTADPKPIPPPPANLGPPPRRPIRMGPRLPTRLIHRVRRRHTVQ